MSPADTSGAPGLAVVMPTLNQASYLDASIASVLAQGGALRRLLVQDAGSTDGTPARLAHWQAGAPALAWTSEPDSGPADGVNRAMRLALRDPAIALVGWLNSDDLLAPGTLDRVGAHFAQHPDHVAVYGHGLHIDADGSPLGRYPTRGPDTPIEAWADGCPICQPTMFLRREALEAILPLDTTLKAAFDYDLWFKLFRQFPGRIGFIDEVLAYSRLHDQGITLSQRRTVALEGLRVVHRHLGKAPAHWLLTYADELRRQLPDGEDMPLRLRLAHTLVEASQWLTQDRAREISARWRADRAISTATRDCVLDVHPDGWMAARTTMRLRCRHDETLILKGRHEGAQNTPLQLQAIGPDGQEQALTVPRRGPFTWTLQVAAQPGMTQHWQLRCTPGFVPARTAPGSTDTRELGWLLDSATLSA